MSIAGTPVASHVRAGYKLGFYTSCKLCLMIPAGYMAKHVSKNPEWLKANQVVDIYSVSGCVSKDFADYIEYWKHNGYWFFDSPDVIRAIARENSLSLEGTSLFYYEAYESEYDDGWKAFGPDSSLPTNVVMPVRKQLEGFDVVTFFANSAPECSPLSCNHMAEELPTNVHCLFASFQDAKMHVNSGAFKDCEPGPYRIFSVYSVDWL